MPADAIASGLRRVGASVINAITRVGFSTRFFLVVLSHTPDAFRRGRLTMREIYFAGVLSLVIIMVSGLFVGMVLGLQGYDSLNKYGAGESLGITSVVVTHDVYESLKIVDYLYFVSDGRIISQGTPEEVRHSSDPFVRQFVDGAPDGPVPFHYPAPPYADELVVHAR